MVSVHKQRLVWQDFRDVGYGEIYLKDLNSGVLRRITDDPEGQKVKLEFELYSDGKKIDEATTNFLGPIKK